MNIKQSHNLDYSLIIRCYRQKAFDEHGVMQSLI